MKLLLLITTLIAQLSLIAQPKWALKRPISESGRFYYFDGQGESKQEAYLDAVQSMLEQIGELDVQGSTEKVTKVTEENKEFVYQNIIAVDAGKKKFNVFPVHYEVEGSFHYVLLGTPKNKVSNAIGGVMGKAPFIWRSAIPGLAQFYNKEPKKGLLFSVGEVALIGSTIFCFNESSDQKDQANLALLNGNLAQYNTYDQNSNNWRTTGTILGIGVISLWVLNVIDASASEKHLYVFNDRKMKLDVLASNSGFGVVMSF